MKKRSFLVPLLLCLVMLLSVIPVYGAPVNSITLTDQEISNLKVKFNSEGVPKDKQVLLIQKIKNGELIDSMNSEKLKALPEDFFSLTNIDSEKKYVFPDGSYCKISAIDIIPENEQKLLDAIGDKKAVDKLINNNKKSEQMVQASGSYTYTKWIQYDFNATGGGFTCDYTTASDINTGRSVINYVDDEMTWAVGGQTNSETLKTPRPAQIGTSPAQASLRWRFVAMGGAGSFYYGFTWNLLYEKTWIS
ncbi:hypothetical protein [Desulfosporosinus nitroreducens]|uniref:hypothetical protein n=1 Tax=Desulfosporosinus nitroreducens TaxID=2018668 RepID=UPI00207D3130|nr:hypothetical protein [Desulfosporosinus nitroreducens]MCO1604685.1 hypothetical protein [Desulfosporosinus nitroreducens]